MRRDLARHLRAAGLAGADDIHGVPGGEVLDVDRAPRQLGEQDVALDLHLLGGCRPAGKAQARAGRTFVHLPTGRQ